MRQMFASKMLEPVPIPGDFQGQAGLGSRQHDLAVVFLFIAGELGEVTVKGPFQL